MELFDVRIKDSFVSKNPLYIFRILYPDKLVNLCIVFALHYSYYTYITNSLIMHCSPSLKVVIEVEGNSCSHRLTRVREKVGWKN